METMTVALAVMLTLGRAGRKMHFLLGRRKTRDEVGHG